MCRCLALRRLPVVAKGLGRSEEFRVSRWRCAHEGQRSTSVLFLGACLPFFCWVLWLLRQSLRTAACWAAGQGAKLPTSPCLPSAGITRTYHSACLFEHGFRSNSSPHAYIYPSSCLPRPLILTFLAWFSDVWMLNGIDCPTRSLQSTCKQILPFSKLFSCYYYNKLPQF